MTKNKIPLSNDSPTKYTYTGQFYEVIYTSLRFSKVKERNINEISIIFNMCEYNDNNESYFRRRYVHIGM